MSRPPNPAVASRRAPRPELLVAVVLDGNTAVEVQALRRALGDRRLARIAPHVTLAPPTTVAAEAMADVAAEVMAGLHRVARRHGAVSLTLGSPTTFAPATPTVHLPVADPDGDLAALHAAVSRPPMRIDRRPFAPHVTLCSGMDPDRIAAACDLLAGYCATLWVQRLSLLVRPAEQPAWITLDDVDLDGVRTVGTGPLATELATGTVVGPAAAALVETATAGGVVAPAPPPEPPEVTPVGRAPLVITARREGTVVGVAWGAAVDGIEALHGVAVDQVARGQGVGTQLVREWQFRRRWRAARPSFSR